MRRGGGGGGEEEEAAANADRSKREDVQFDYADSSLFGPDCFFGVYLATTAILFGLPPPPIHPYVCVHSIARRHLPTK